MTVTTGEIVTIDPLFDDAGTAAMVDLCTRFGRYRLYAEHEKIEVDIGRGLAQRHDAVRNFLRTRGARGADSDEIAARTSYFREEYGYDGQPLIDGIEPFLQSPRLIEAAQRVHGLPVIEPAIAYANLYLPGQELAVHTDVPEFRGANRKLLPQWLLVVMHHSGLFQEWYLPIATGIAYFHDAVGGALVYWPDGPDGRPKRHLPRANTAVVLDTDSVFHGVDPVGAASGDVPKLAPGSALVALDDGGWALRDANERELRRYDAEELRFSVSWKAYCFGDEAARDRWREHSDDLTYEVIVARLADDLRARGRIDGSTAEDGKLGLAMIDEYVRFPADDRQDGS
jgi:hypothetical protein